MELKDQVTSLKLSKKLKELGCKQDSLFYWVDINNLNEEKERNVINKSRWVVEYGEPHERFYRFYSAFTSAELGDVA